MCHLKWSLKIMDDALHYINVKLGGGELFVYYVFEILIGLAVSYSFQKEYIHRVGRTARGINGRGHALLILRPEELGFLRYLKQARVNVMSRIFKFFLLLCNRFLKAKTNV